MRKTWGLPLTGGVGRTITAEPKTHLIHTADMKLCGIPPAGTGEFGKIDVNTGSFEPLCFLPGLARGLVFTGDYAVIGLSRPRNSRTFEGLPLNERLDGEGIGAQCAICIVNLLSGDIEHRLEIGGIIEEIYDVALLPGVTRPMALGFRSEEIRLTIKPEPLPQATNISN